MLEKREVKKKRVVPPMAPKVCALRSSITPSNHAHPRSMSDIVRGQMASSATLLKCAYPTPKPIIRENILWNSVKYLSLLDLEAASTSHSASQNIIDCGLGDLDSGVSLSVNIRPSLGLLLSLILAQPAATGALGGFRIQDSPMIQKSLAQLVLGVNEDPMKELLSAEVESFNMTDVKDFPRDMIDVRKLDLHHDFLEFQKAQFYTFQEGTRQTFYPKGFSFEANMILFGGRADIKCVVDTAKLKVSLKGGVNNFALGPLTVRGTTGPRAFIEYELGPADQHLLIDGVVSLFGLKSTVHIKIDMLPTPKCEWFMQLNFTNLLRFQVHVTLIGPISFKDLSNAWESPGRRSGDGP